MIKTFKYSFCSDSSVIENLSEYLSESLLNIKFSKDFFDHCLLLLTEGVNNAIIHGNKREIDKKVLLEIILELPYLKFIITDEGSGFETDKVPDPTLPENLLRDHGRGLFIMKHFTEKMYYSKTPAGNSLTMVLKIN